MPAYSVTNARPEASGFGSADLGQVLSRGIFVGGEASSEGEGVRGDREDAGIFGEDALVIEGSLQSVGLGAAQRLGEAIDEVGGKADKARP